MDDSNQFSDVEVIIDDDVVYIRQYNEDVMAYDMIMMTPKMYYELLNSNKVGEGMFVLDTGK